VLASKFEFQLLMLAGMTEKWKKNENGNEKARNNETIAVAVVEAQESVASAYRLLFAIDFRCSACELRLARDLIQFSFYYVTKMARIVTHSIGRGSECNFSTNGFVY
jgi:hypothetical protein